MTTWTRWGLCTAIVLIGTALEARPAAAEDKPDPAAAFQQQKWDEAEKGYAEIVETQPANALAWYRLGYARHALGRYESALEAHEKAAGMPFPSANTAAYNAVCACSLLGRIDDALGWLAKATQGGFSNGGLLDLDTDLVNLRADDRFWPVRNRVVQATRYRTLIPGGKGDPRQFDFWIGDWESENRKTDGKGGWAAGNRLHTRVFPVVDGNALVEYSESAPGAAGTFGFSVRAYDPRAQEWVLILNWPSKDTPSFYALTGRVHHGRGEFVSRVGGGPLATQSQTRFSFSDIRPDGYRWDSASTSDGGNSWRTTLVFEANRLDAAKGPLKIGPSRTNQHAAGDVFRAFDFLIGTWSGTRRTRGAEGKWGEQQVTLTTQSILEGSALVDQLTVGDGARPFKEFTVRSYEPQRSAWVQYDIDNRTPRFRRFEGVVPTAGALQMTGKPGPGSAGAAGTLAWTERSADVLKSEWRVNGQVFWMQELRRTK